MRPAWTRLARTIAVPLAATALTVLYFVDPTRHMLAPPCPYLTLSGLACPGCGLTRAVHLLLHGDLARAFAYNPWAFVAAAAVMAFAILPRITDEARTLRLRNGISYLMVVVTLAFWVWRNTAAYPFVRV